MFTPEETVRAIRASLIGEQDAISQYDAQAEMTDNPIVRKTLEDISREEKVHQGQLVTLLSVLGDEQYLTRGDGEVKKIMRELDMCLDATCNELRAIVTSDQSDGLMKKIAREDLANRGIPE